MAETAGSSTPPTPPTTPALPPAAKVTQSPTYIAVINELNVNSDQLLKRQNLMREIELALTARYGVSNRLMSYFVRFDHRRAMMGSADIASLEAILNTITGAEQINILLHSPGGDPTVIEKMIHMCRAHMSGAQPKLRVIVPNIAKSAATLFALGADTILMGYCSELGPIDPQVPISVSGVTQWVSAFAFVGSRDKLMEQLAEAIKRKEPTAGYLTQLATLDIPFTHEMENWIEFSRKTGVTLLDKYMLKPKFPRAAQRKKKAEGIAKKLLSKQLFPVHPQFINGETAKNLGLEVEILSKDEPLWDLLWTFYIRSEVQMNLPIQAPLIKVKSFESSQGSLVIQDTAS
jgi:hypothetical protein